MVICVVSLISLLVLICVMRTCSLCIRYWKRVAIGKVHGIDVIEKEMFVFCLCI